MLAYIEPFVIILSALSSYFIYRESAFLWLSSSIMSATLGYICFLNNLYFCIIYFVIAIITNGIGFLLFNFRVEIKQKQLAYCSINERLLLFGAAFMVALLGAVTASQYTDDPYPYIDAFVLPFALLAEYLRNMRKIERHIAFFVSYIALAPIFICLNYYIISVMFIFFLLVSIYAFWKEMKILQIQD